MDVDGDGVPEFGTSGGVYRVFDLQCVGPMKPAKCSMYPGELWRRDIHDTSTGWIGASAFDLDGDGRPEILLRDECWLRALRGTDGKALFAVNITSSTGTENPVIADVDGDGHAEIVVGSDDYYQTCPGMPEEDTGTPWLGYTSGLFVLRDPMRRWMPARPVWNEHGYHVTNILDDLTIPLVEPPNWLTWNNYRQQEQGMSGVPRGLGDLTTGVPPHIDPAPDDCSVAWTLSANVCNRGGGAFHRPIAGAFYQGRPVDPQPKLVCVATTRGSLEAGSCQTVSCAWNAPPQDPVDLFFRAGDDGKGGKALQECKAGNNLLLLPGARCGVVQ